MLEIEKYKTGIKIKKSNKGKFTSYCGGNVTSACIQRGKNSSNPTIRKRATFAANARKWKHQDGGVLKGQWTTPIDNTRVVGSDGMTAGQRVQMQEQLQKARATRARYLEEQRLRNQPQLNEWTAEKQAASDRIKAEKERNEWLYKNQHLWNIDPTQSVTRDNIQFAFNNAGLAGEPIRQGLAVAIGAGAVRQLPNAGRFIYNGAKNEAGMFAKSVTTAQGRQMWGQAASNFGKAVVDPRQWTIGKNWVGNTTFQLGKAELYGNVSGGLYLGLQGKPLDGSMTPEEQRRADAIASDSVNTWFEDLDPNAQYVIE